MNKKWVHSDHLLSPIFFLENKNFAFIFLESGLYFLALMFPLPACYCHLFLNSHFKTIYFEIFF